MWTARVSFLGNRSAPNSGQTVNLENLSENDLCKWLVSGGSKYIRIESWEEVYSVKHSRRMHLPLPEKISTDHNKEAYERRMLNKLADWEDYSHIRSFINHQRVICTSRHQTCKHRFGFSVHLKISINKMLKETDYRGSLTSFKNLIIWTSKDSANLNPGES